MCVCVCVCVNRKNEGKKGRRKKKEGVERREGRRPEKEVDIRDF